MAWGQMRFKSRHDGAFVCACYMRQKSRLTVLIRHINYYTTNLCVHDLVWSEECSSLLVNICTPRSFITFTTLPANIHKKYFSVSENSVSVVFYLKLKQFFVWKRATKILFSFQTGWRVKKITPTWPKVDNKWKKRRYLLYKSQLWW